MNTWPSYSKKEREIVNNILKKGNLNIWQSDLNKKFENNFAKYIGSNYSISVSNGSVALDIALKILEISKSDEVIVASKSYFISAGCIINNGATPIFADINYDDQTINIESVKKKITSKTKAIICVHLGGQPCDMKKIIQLAKKFKLKIIEDCAQAHGAKIGDKKVGSFGDVSCWSFCRDKIISAGEGGMLVTKTQKLYYKAWSYREGGRNLKLMRNNQTKNVGFKYIHDFFGLNSRMTAIQAAICNYQLGNLDKNIKKRNIIATKYINIIKKYDFLDVYKSPTDITNSFYRLYFKINKNLKNKRKIRELLLTDFIKARLPFEEGSCSEIYKEKSFRKKNKSLVLQNANILSQVSLAIKINHVESNKHTILVLKKFDYILKKFSKKTHI